MALQTGSAPNGVPAQRQNLVEERKRKEGDFLFWRSKKSETEAGSYECLERWEMLAYKKGNRRLGRKGGAVNRMRTGCVPPPGRQGGKATQAGTEWGNPSESFTVTRLFSKSEQHREAHDGERLTSEVPCGGKSSFVAGVLFFLSCSFACRFDFKVPARGV